MKLYRRLGVFFVALAVAIGGISFIAASPALASSVFQIKPYGSNKCLDVTGVSQANGAYLQLYTCLGGSQYNQLFFLRAVPGTYDTYQIVAEHSGKCLDVEGVSQLSGALVQQYDCLGYGQTNQIFHVFYWSNPPGYTITATHSWQDICYQGLFNGANIFQWYGGGCRWSITQLF